MVLSSGNRGPRAQVKAEQVGSHGDMEEQEEERDYEEGDFSKSIEAGVQVCQVHMYMYMLYIMLYVCTCTCVSMTCLHVVECLFLLLFLLLLLLLLLFLLPLLLLLLLLPFSCTVYPSLEGDLGLLSNTSPVKGHKRKSDDDDDLWMPQGKTNTHVHNTMYIT